MPKPRKKGKKGLSQADECVVAQVIKTELGVFDKLVLREACLSVASTPCHAKAEGGAVPSQVRHCVWQWTETVLLSYLARLKGFGIGGSYLVLSKNVLCEMSGTFVD